MRKNEMPDDFRHRANRLGNYACIEQFPVAVLWHRRVRNERSFDLFKNSSKLLDIPGVTQRAVVRVTKQVPRDAIPFSFTATPGRPTITPIFHHGCAPGVRICTTLGTALAGTMP